MISGNEIIKEELRYSPRMIVDEAIKRGWKIQQYYPGYSMMLIEKSDGKVIQIYSTTPPTTSFSAGRSADNKYLAYKILVENNIPTPETYRLGSSDSFGVFEDVLKEHGTLVVKPLDAAHGNGVTVNVDSLIKLEYAVERARKFSDTVLAQEQVAAVDVRVSCIDFKPFASLSRLPARVIGDGVSNIEELIQIENASDRRGENYRKSLNIINVEASKIYLGDRLKEIPGKDAWVQVVGTANVGSGGEIVDVTDMVPESLLKYAEKTAVAFNLPVCGVDFLVEDIEGFASPKVIEVNKCPALFMHDIPTVGKSRGAIVAYMDYLSSI